MKRSKNNTIDEKELKRKGFVMKKTMFAAIIYCCATMFVYADDYESGFNGEQVFPVKSEHIRMARERVEIFADWGENGAWEHRLYHVCAEFILINDSNEPQSIQIAFPGSWVNSDFARFIDGELVYTEKLEDNERKTVHTSQVYFGPRQVHRVIVKYIGASDAVSGAGTGGGHWEYILKTGALWKDKIEEIKIMVHFPMDMPGGGIGPFNINAVSLSPKGYKVDERTVTWEFKNIEPEENIIIDCDDNSVLEASDPLKNGVPADEIPGIQLQRAIGFWAGHRDDKKAIELFETIRKSYPASYEATLIDYYLGKMCSWHYNSWQFVRAGDHTIEKWNDDTFAPEKAIQYYELALKQVLPDEMRKRALGELFVLYTVYLKDLTQSQNIFKLIKKEKLSFHEDFDFLDKISIVSPEKGLELLKTLKVDDSDKSEVDVFEAEIRGRIPKTE